MSEMQLGTLRAGSDFRIRDHDPEGTEVAGRNKEEAEAETEGLRSQLASLQELLFADRKHSMLIVLQGMDTSGKDGTIRHVFSGVNPQGVSVASFKVPTLEEASHDFLWRVHAHAPEKGRITIFNRSHYEDVLAARVHHLIPDHHLKGRIRAINDFERSLTDQGTTILKFFLNISRSEQGERLRERIKDPSKHWKLSEADLEERKLWDDYMTAYEEAIAATTTEWAPWFIVPSNHKWVRNLVVSTALVRSLEALKLAYPPGPKNIDRLKID